MGQACSVVIAFIVNENLSLIFQAAESGGVQDAVAVALVSSTVFRLLFRVATPFGAFAADAVWRQALVFVFFKFLACKIHTPALGTDFLDLNYPNYIITPLIG